MNSNVYILFRYGTRSGKIDTTMTGFGSAMLRIWALNHTPKTKTCIVIERETGKVVFKSVGTPSGFPDVTKDAGTCEDYEIPFSFLQSIRDERFDKEESV